MITIDQVIRSQRRSMALEVRPDGSLLVRAPLHTPDLLIRAFVESKAAWIKTHQAAARSRPSPSSAGFTAGARFWYLGTQYALRIDPHARAALSFQNEFVLSAAAQGNARIVFTRWYQQQARRLLGERVSRLAAQHGFTYKSIRITSAAARWGSCGANNSLNFAWRLVMAPPEVIDYVVVHELAHTRVKNHSRAFWEVVRAAMPDYAHHRQWLRSNGAALKL